MTTPRPFLCALAAVVVLACGGENTSSVDTGGGGTSLGSAGQSGSGDNTTNPGADGATTSSTTEADDGTFEDVCLQWCLNAQGTDCSEVVTGGECFTRCIDRLESGAANECADERLAELTCEANSTAAMWSACETVECEDDYKRADLCHGYCVHTDGSVGGGWGVDVGCSWRTGCYGYEFEVECTEAGSCTCFVDGAITGDPCEAGMSFDYNCGGRDFHVFNTCCHDRFEALLLP